MLKISIIASIVLLNIGCNSCKKETKISKKAEPLKYYNDAIAETSISASYDEEHSIKLIFEAKKQKVISGKSKFGGQPDIPVDLKWPSNGYRSLSFIGQINLRDLKKGNIKSDLPEDGILYFFYDIEKMPWGFKPEDKKAWKVIYSDKTQKLTKGIPSTKIKREYQLKVSFWVPIPRL